MLVKIIRLIVALAGAAFIGYAFVSFQLEVGTDPTSGNSLFWSGFFVLMTAIIIYLVLDFIAQIFQLRRDDLPQRKC
jgi:hypothetical protein